VAKRHGTDQIDFRIDAKGVTPIPAIHQPDLIEMCVPPTRRIVSNFVKSSEADPKGLLFSRSNVGGGTYPSTMIRGRTWSLARGGG